MLALLSSRPLSSFLSGCFAITLGLAPVAAFGATSSRFTVSQPTQVPGLTLKPGTYTIQVVDHLSERYIVRVDDPKTHAHSTFLALADPAAPKPASPGQELWQNAPSGKQYMRGWLFPGQPTVLEFVYPKADAVAIAKSNNAKVPAIDPVSEGRPNLKGLSKSDLELVTLWLLSSTHVGPSDSAAGIQAERYPEVAKLTPPKKPGIAKLPQTASDLPWIGLLGAFSLAMALVMRFRAIAGVRP